MLVSRIQALAVFLATKADGAAATAVVSSCQRAAPLGFIGAQFRELVGAAGLPVLGTLHSCDKYYNCYSFLLALRSLSFLRFVRPTCFSKAKGNRKAQMNYGKNETVDLFRHFSTGSELSVQSSIFEAFVVGGPRQRLVYTGSA